MCVVHVCLFLCGLGILGGGVVSFLKGSYGKSDVTKLVIDSEGRSKYNNKNEWLKTDQMVGPLKHQNKCCTFIHAWIHTVHSRSYAIIRKINLFLFQMFQESVDTKRSLHHWVLIVAFIVFAQGRSASLSSYRHKPLSNSFLSSSVLSHLRYT